MAFRTRRQGRYQKLRQSGFLPFESAVLSRVPFKVPYMLPMMRKRLGDFEVALKAKWSQAQYEKAIKRDYIEKGWMRKTRLGKVVYDPWAMLRDQEDRYRDKHPDYKSPWEKRRKDFRKFVKQLEASLEKYPRKMPVVKLKYLPEGGAEIVEE